MAASRQHGGASSSSPASWTYNVFLSFRGSDTRKNFTSHLYAALKWAGIHTFLDEDDVERGEDILNEIERAIEESQMSVIVFSADYASSEYCLDEVVKIMLCGETKGHIVLPIFYDVHPDQVCKQSGNYAQAFSRHDLVFCADRVKQWRKSLEQVTDIGGVVLGGRHESYFIQDIVKLVQNKLKRTVLHVPAHLVGIESRVESISEWLRDESNDDVSIAMIHGMGGVGKTTIAKIVFNTNFQAFDICSFLHDVNETSKQHNGLVELQRRLLHDISKCSTGNISHVDRGMVDIKNALCNRRALIVLDDVGNMDQFDAIIGMSSQLYKGSRVILTTRCQQLRMSPNSCKKFLLNELNEIHSLELFSWRAFRQPYPIKEYEEYSKRVVQHCLGLPLALEVLGQCLSNLSIELWKSAVQEPEKIDGSGKIQKILRLSYNSLEDERDQILFLDICCFFFGKAKNDLVKVLDCCDCYRPLGIQKLVDRSLISVDEYGMLTMHQLLRQMGREIVRLESIEDPGKRSRLWHYRDVCTVLRRQRGTKHVMSLILETPQTSLDLEIKALSRMKNLKLLHFSNVNLKGSYKKFPKGLVWLYWEGCPLECIPNEFTLEDLVFLEMKKSKIRDFSNNAWYLPELKVLNLSYSTNLTHTPEFSGIQNLEQLILKGCKKLVEVHRSIGVLQKLVVLDLSRCTGLIRLPAEIVYLKSLEQLDLTGCATLFELHPEHAEIVPSSQLALTTQNKIAASPMLASMPHSLVVLTLSCCNISFIPDSLFQLSCLEELYMTGNPFSSLPEGIKGLPKLSALSVAVCDNLEYLPELPSSIEFLFVEYCTSLRKIANHLPSFYLLPGVVVPGCSQAVEVQGMFTLESIKEVDLNMLCNLGLLGNWWGSLKYDQELQATLYNRFTVSEMVLQDMQVLQELGIWSVFCNEDEMPALSLSEMVIEHPLRDVIPSQVGDQRRRSHYNRTGYGVRHFFDVPTKLGSKICGLDLCVAYMCKLPRETFAVPPSLLAEIHNRTMSLKWSYLPAIVRIENTGRSMLWLSHWRFGHLIESGDQLEIAVQGYNDLWALSFRVQFVYHTTDENECSEKMLAAEKSQGFASFPWAAFPDTDYIIDHSVMAKGVTVTTRTHFAFSFN